MILIRLEHLDRETKKKLDIARWQYHRGEITEEQHDSKHNSIMDNFRIMTEAILRGDKYEEQI